MPVYANVRCTGIFPACQEYAVRKSLHYYSGTNPFDPDNFILLYRKAGKIYEISESRIEGNVP